MAFMGMALSLGSAAPAMHAPALSPCIYALGHSAMTLLVPLMQSNALRTVACGKDVGQAGAAARVYDDAALHLAPRRLNQFHIGAVRPPP